MCSIPTCTSRPDAASTRCSWRSQAAIDELAHDVAVHIAFARPSYISPGGRPAAEVAAERETVEKIARNEGKPEAALPKIVEGRMNGWFKERVLLEQPYAKDEKRTIAELSVPAIVRNSPRSLSATEAGAEADGSTGGASS